MKNSFEAHWAGLLASQPALNAANTHWIALSGGADSVALLQLLVGLPKPIRPQLEVVHVNHGLSASASAWAEFCQRISDEAQLPFHLFNLEPESASIKALGVEGWARSARYAAIADLIGSGDVVHCAQHQDDQAETLLLALMRGAGPDGQASMPVLRELGSGWLCRPLLGFSRDDLRRYAQETQGEWIEDESNQDTRFDRNFLRSNVLPTMTKRWPSASRSLSRAAAIAAEASEANQWFTKQALQGFEAAGACFINSTSHQFRSSWLSISAIAHQPKSVRNQILREWIAASGLPTLPFSKTGELDRSILGAGFEKNPHLNWDDSVFLWRYANRLWVFRQTEAILPSSLSVGESVEFAGGVLTLEAAENGFSLGDEQSVRLSQRSGGERFQKAGASHSTQLKKFFNERAVLPWCRESIPLLWAGEELVAVAGVWQKADRVGWRLSWLPEPRVTAE